MHITNQFGFLTAKDVVTLVQKQKEEQKIKEERKKLSQEIKENQRNQFIKCKEKCVCGKKEGKCDASGLKECSSCHTILKGQCCKQSLNPAEMMKDANQK